jgi:cation:H+ antiporter
MLEEFFFGLPLPVNVLLIFASLYVVVRASHFMVDGAVHMAHEFRISPLVIGATVVAMGTSSAELAVNLVAVLGDGDTSVVAGNILGSNLVNFGVELGVAALIAGLISVPRNVLQKDMPLYFAATGLLTALIFDGQIGRLEAVLMLAMFVATVYLIIQYARTEHEGGVLLVEVTEAEAISHPIALKLTRGQALLYSFGGLVVLVLASRLLTLNTASLALMLGIPEFVIGLVIIGPGTSLPEIASSIQAVRRGHPDIVLGTAFGSNLFNLLFGLGLPALIRPLEISETATLSFIFMNAVNISLLALILLGVDWLGRPGAINRVTGVYLVATYVGFLTFQVIQAVGGTFADWLMAGALMGLIGWLLWVGRRWVAALVTTKAEVAKQKAAGGNILCATRGGQASQHAQEQAIELAREENTELLFLYVFDQSIIQGIATPIVINVEEQIERVRDFLVATAQQQAEQAGVEARVVARAGDLREQIRAVASEEGVNLIVLGGPSGDSSLFEREALWAFAAEVEEAIGVPVITPQP